MLCNCFWQKHRLWHYWSQISIIFTYWIDINHLELHVLQNLGRNSEVKDEVFGYKQILFAKNKKASNKIYWLESRFNGATPFY